MDGFALVLVLIAAFLHAYWNLLAKRSGGGLIFLWLLGTLVSVLYLPLVLYYWERFSWSPPALLFLAGTSVLHLLYFIFLQKGYAVGDLSLVYPLARGLGPFLATVSAIVLFGERPGPLALAGVVLIVGGVFFLARGTSSGDASSRRGAVFYGILTGVSIALYTLWDKYAVSQLRIEPLLVAYFSFMGYLVLLLPYALLHRRRLREKWRIHKREILGVAILAPLSYLLILMAMVFTPVSYIAPAREVSILVGAILGRRLLLEDKAFSRLPAAGAIVAGVIALALG